MNKFYRTWIKIKSWKIPKWQAETLLVHFQAWQWLFFLRQFFVHCEEERYKLEILCDLYECLSISQLIIFVNSKRRVEDVFHFLNAQDHTCSCIHGGMSTEERKVNQRKIFQRKKYLVWVENARISHWSFSCAYFVTLILTNYDFLDHNRVTVVILSQKWQ